MGATKRYSSDETVMGSSRYWCFVSSDKSFYQPPFNLWVFVGPLLIGLIE